MKKNNAHLTYGEKLQELQERKRRLEKELSYAEKGEVDYQDLQLSISTEIGIVNREIRQLKVTREKSSVPI